VTVGRQRERYVSLCAFVRYRPPSSRLRTT
jgi:hypothetical protein